jgi:hypothetical protein
MRKGSLLRELPTLVALAIIVSLVIKSFLHPFRLDGEHTSNQ